MMNNVRVAMIFLTVAAAASAMGRRPPQKEDAHAATAEKTMILEWKGQMGGPKVHSHLIADDEATWTSVWRELGQDAPTLDLSKFAAVVVFVGEKPTGGFTAAFEEPVARGDDLIVRYRIPKPDGFVTQAFAHPWKVRAVPRPKGRVIVEYLTK